MKYGKAGLALGAIVGKMYLILNAHKSHKERTMN